MKWVVRLDGRARKTLDGLPGDLRARLVRKLRTLEVNQRPPGVEKLSGMDGIYRVRVGDWRIVYAIRDRELVVIVIRIGHRREVYRH